LRISIGCFPDVVPVDEVPGRAADKLLRADAEDFLARAIDVNHTAIPVHAYDKVIGTFHDLPVQLFRPGFYGIAAAAAGHILPASRLLFTLRLNKKHPGNIPGRVIIPFTYGDSYCLILLDDFIWRYIIIDANAIARLPGTHLKKKLNEENVRRFQARRRPVFIFYTSTAGVGCSNKSCGLSGSGHLLCCSLQRSSAMP
jgi:hypothetical protein